MGKSLIVVESKTKTKTIEKIVGPDFIVSHSQGHVRDLPNDNLGVDVDKDFEPTYSVLNNKKGIIKALKKLRKETDQLYLAMDPDREGEAIAWHLADILDGGDVKRIQFNEITESAVREALRNPREIDVNLVNAQQARRVLDRLVGYKLSPILWRNVKPGLSAGRVQSVAVRLVVEREREIQQFEPQEYWTIEADFQTREDAARFAAKLNRIDGGKVEISDEATARGLESEIRGLDFVIQAIEKKKVTKRPPPPFITSSLQQEASRKFGFNAKRTMAVAQNLYEGKDIEVGLITYMRTDSFRLANEAVNSIRGFVQTSFGAAFLPKTPNVYSRKKGAVQDAHEAIRPTDVNRTPEQVKPYLPKDQYNLYKIIWARAVASQMQPALLDTVGVDAAAGRFVFRATGSTITFPGFLKVYEETVEEGEGGDETQNMLPELTQGAALDTERLESNQHFTKPPPRYSDATLIRTLEEKGIGRPSTYAPTLETIIDRGYVTRQKRTLIPTEWGFVVNDLLLESFSDILDYDFTAKLEEDLDKVERGETAWTDVLQDFYAKFAPELESAGKGMKYKPKPTGRECPGLVDDQPCGAELMVKLSRYGLFLGCSNWPKCKYTESLDSGAADKKAEDAAPREEPRPTGEKCPKCDAPVVVKKSRAGDEFLSCSAYPKCRWSKSIPLDIGCPEQDCDGNMVSRRSKKRKGVFYGCDKYPDCKFVMWSKPTGEKCPKCGSLMAANRKAGANLDVCSNRDCGFVKPVEDGADESQSTAAAE